MTDMCVCVCVCVHVCVCCDEMTYLLVRQLDFFDETHVYSFFNGCT